MNWVIVFFVCIIGCVSPAWSTQAVELSKIRVNNDKKLTRVVLDFSKEPEYRHFKLPSPARFVVELTHAHLKTRLDATQGLGFKRLRSSTSAKDKTIKIVFELSAGYTPIIFPLKPSGKYGHRLVIDFKNEAPKMAPKPKKTTASIPLKPVVIALDPGHGGHDPGSIGPNKLYEKHVVLNVSKKLKHYLEEYQGIKVVLTRDKDVYISPNERADIARFSNADLLISIHADSFSTAQPKGASVWVLSSKRANREMQSWMKRKTESENLLGGLGSAIEQVGEQPYLTQTFLELAMDKTRDMGYVLAQKLLDDLNKVAELHKEKPQQASLAVLKAPDIPSVLVEVGFISNPQEAQLLKSNVYQEKVAKALAQGVHQFVLTKPPRGSYYQNTRYVVQAGDRLGSIAKQHGKTVKQLLAANQLKSDQIHIGQTLIIPRS